MGSNATVVEANEAFYFSNSISGGPDTRDCDLKMVSSAADEGGYREELVDQVEEALGRRRKTRVGDATIVSVMESTGKALENALLRSAQAQIDAYNHNSELDRIQRKCISDNLVGVLGRLADSLSRLAERL